MEFNIHLLRHYWVYNCPQGAAHQGLGKPGISVVSFFFFFFLFRGILISLLESHFGFFS